MRCDRSERSPNLVVDHRGDDGAPSVCVAGHEPGRRAALPIRHPDRIVEEDLRHVVWCHSVSGRGEVPLVRLVELKELGVVWMTQGAPPWTHRSTGRSYRANLRYDR